MKYRANFQEVISAAILLVLLLYTYSDLVVTPNIGFYFNEADGTIIDISEPANGTPRLQVNDKIEQVGPVTWQKYRSDTRQPLFEPSFPGQEIEINVSRDGQPVSIIWTMPAPNWDEFVSRMVNIWWLSYFFWVAGIATVLLIRPRDLRQNLLVAFLYLTALWLMFGSIAGGRIWDSAVLFRVCIWLCVPVYLHFHWVFPDPIRSLSNKIWLPLYLIGIGLAVAEWFQLLPVNSSIGGALLAFSGSIILLVGHFVFKPEQRRDVGILGVITFFAFFPSIIFLIFRIFSALVLVGILGLFALAGLPAAYFYIAYKRQPGWLEIRANRLISLFLFLTLIFIVAFISATLIAELNLGNGTIPLTTSAMFILAAVAIISFSPFQRFIEIKLLGMPLAPEQVIETYTTRITTSLDKAKLVKLLREEIMPSLQVRQSLLLQQFSENQPEIVYTQGLAPDLITGLVGHALESMSSPSSRFPPAGSQTWVKLTIPLTVDNTEIGRWHFGQHDPNDVYSQSDIRILELLAHQTAIALANINQTKLVQTLYETNIQRQEEERTILARVLHDDVLNDLAVLSLNRRNNASRFDETYAGLTNRMRLIIRGLRPAMLDYGLWRALDDLVGDLQDRITEDLKIVFTVPKSDFRYPLDIEQHLFRIVQQAVENALEHAQAANIQIDGTLQQNQLILLVEDDGCGLPEGMDLNLSNLLKNKQYGLVGMMERAEIIGAHLDFSSKKDQFTKVQLEWRILH